MKLAIVGGSGFIGQHLVTHVLDTTAHEVVVTSRRARSAPQDARMTWRVADLDDVDSLITAFAGADVVVNLAAPDAPPAWCDNLSDALLAVDGRALVHCSTAVVVGRTPTTLITEKTVPAPQTPYEHAKLAVECRLTERLAGRAPLTIARPTVVFGRGGRNLVTLAASLQHGGAVTATARRLLFGVRPMHLVPVETVASALAFMAERASGVASTVYQIAADDDPENNFRAVETRLAAGLHLPPPRWPPLTLPAAVLSSVLALRGRSDTSPRRRYANGALQHDGFDDVRPVGSAVEAFGRWYAAAHRQA